MRPYKVIPNEPGAARVVERKTNRTLGYVLQNFYGDWQPMRDGKPLTPHVRYRAEAARIVAVSALSTPELAEWIDQ